MCTEWILSLVVTHYYQVFIIRTLSLVHDDDDDDDVDFVASACMKNQIYAFLSSILLLLLLSFFIVVSSPFRNLARGAFPGSRTKSVSVYACKEVERMRETKNYATLALEYMWYISLCLTLLLSFYGQLVIM